MCSSEDRRAAASEPGAVVSGAKRSQGRAGPVAVDTRRARQAGGEAGEAVRARRATRCSFGDRDRRRGGRRLLRRGSNRRRCVFRRLECRSRLDGRHRLCRIGFPGCFGCCSNRNRRHHGGSRFVAGDTRRHARGVCGHALRTEQALGTAGPRLGPPRRASGAGHAAVGAEAAGRTECRNRRTGCAAVAQLTSARRARQTRDLAGGRGIGSRSTLDAGGLLAARLGRPCRTGQAWWRAGLAVRSGQADVLGRGGTHGQGRREQGGDDSDDGQRSHPPLLAEPAAREKREVQEKLPPGREGAGTLAAGTPGVYRLDA